jgi:hypothetical protein
MLHAARLESVSASRSRAIARSVVAGFIASLGMLVAFGLAYGGVSLLVAYGLLDRVTWLRDWFQGLTRNPVIDLAKPNVYQAISLYLVGGLAWALLYGLVVEPRLSGPPWRRGLTFAVLPWLVSLLVFLPLVGGGVLGLALGAGPLPIIGNLLLHVVYGLVLGAMFGPWGRLVDAERDSVSSLDRLAVTTSETGAARGIGVGLLVGLLVGGAMTVAGWGGPSTSANSLALLLATALVGAAFGAMLGSMVGLPERGEP